MTDEEYFGWADTHAATFGLNSELVPKMLAAWRAVFSLAGYSVAELHAATNHIAAFGSLRFLNEHLPAIRARITEQRLQQALANRAAAQQESPCHVCQDTGWALVPMPRSVVDGQWVCLTGSSLPTSVVTCKCLRGSRIHAVWQAGGDKPGNKIQPKPMALADYEKQVPHWFQLLGQRAQLDQATALAGRLAAEAEKSVGQLKLYVAEATRSSSRGIA